MIDTSLAYKNTLYNGKRKFLKKATIYLADGTELTIADTNIWQGGFKFDSATTNSGSFDIGCAIIQKFTLRLNNIYDGYSQYDFSGAVIWAYAGLELEDGTEEWLRKGVFKVNTPEVSNGIITLTCYDNINKFDISYNNSTLTYPATRKQIISDICQICDVTDNTGEFDGCNEVVADRPASTYTCRDILSFVAQVGGYYAYCDNTGGLKFGWYDTEAFFSSGDNLDGGNLENYASGDTADGGDFTDYSSGDSYDGGTFETTRKYHHIYSTSSSNVNTDDVTITGIKVITDVTTKRTVDNTVTGPDTGETTTKTEETEETVAMEYHAGQAGYILVISENPLITADNGQKIADHLYSKVRNMVFRPMTLSALGDPSMEAGDTFIFIDRKGNSYRSYITTLSYTIGQYASITCDAQSPLTRGKESEQYSSAVKTAIAMQEVAKKQISKYAISADAMNQLAANALGYYETVVTDTDGSKITYMHNKPDIADSSVVYKKTIDGFFVSRDGGNTYVNGFDSNGNAALNILSAIGIKFDWASGGTLTLGGADNGNGELKILDASGNVILTGNKDGLKGTNFSIGTDGSVSLKGDITANGKIEVLNNDLIATLSFSSGETQMLGGFSYVPGTVTGTSDSVTSDFYKYFKIDTAESLIVNSLITNGHVSSNSIVARKLAVDRVDFVNIGGNNIECDWITIHEMVNTTTVDPALNSDYFSAQAGSIRVFPFLGMVVWHKTFTLGADLPANTNIQVGTVNTAYAPVQMVYLSAGIGLTPTILFVKADGTITVCASAARSAGDNLRVSGCYFYK